MTAVYERLKALQITLPDVEPPVADGYVAAFVPFVQTGNLVYLAGRLAKKDLPPTTQRFRAVQPEILFRRFAFPACTYTHNASTFSETSYHLLTIDEKNLIVEVEAQLSFPSDSSTNGGFELKDAARERRKGLEWQPDPSTTGAEAAKKFIVQLLQELTRSE